MRPAKHLTYRIERLPDVPPVLSFLAHEAGLDARAAYSTFNMGSGYALYCKAGGGEQIVRIAATHGLSALVAGQVEEGPRQVILEPVGVIFDSDQSSRLNRGQPSASALWYEDWRPPCADTGTSGERRVLSNRMRTNPLLRRRVSYVHAGSPRVAAIRRPPSSCAPSSLKAPCETDKVWAKQSPCSTAKLPGSRCRRTGMAPELPRSRRTCPSKEERESDAQSIHLSCRRSALRCLALPARASAAPTVTFKAQAVPIPGFPHTGNILGAGAAVQAEYTITGTEYGGFPPPLIGVNFSLPKGTKLHTSGFPTCAEATLEQFGPIKCPKGSAAGPVGKALGFVDFGTERVQEEAERVSPSTRLAAALSSSPTATRRCRSKSLQRPLRQPWRRRRLRPRAPDRSAARRNVPGAPYASAEDDQRQGRLGVQEARQNDLLRHACRRSARRAASRSSPK